MGVGRISTATLSMTFHEVTCTITFRVNGIVCFYWLPSGKWNCCVAGPGEIVIKLFFVVVIMSLASGKYITIPQLSFSSTY